jgi:DNA (cytosine-5)-methyltransferase 1
MKVLDLFSGIGGFSLGLERAGMETVAFCEFDKHAQKVLKKHWPDVPVYDDVRELTNDRLKSDGIYGIDVITGGFPCQDISVAGKQAGIGEGTRSGLWSEVARLIDDIQPRFAIMENVTALISGDSGRWFGRVLGDLAEIGYDAEWHCIPASELGAHHHRDRVWIVAYPASGNDRGDAGKFQSKNEQQATKRQKRGICTPINADSSGLSIKDDLADTDLQRQERNKEAGNFGEVRARVYEQLKRCFNSNESEAWPVEPELGRVANGIPNRSHRLKQLGNSVVPQIPELIGRAIMQAEA